MLKEGMAAPKFTLPDKDGNMVSLSDFAGKKVVVYFYPKDNTSGCTKEACAYADAYDDYKNIGVDVIGISKDSQASHLRFADKYNLPFTLLSDTELVAIKGFDVWQEKKMCGKVSMGVVRTTYLIDEKGVIEKVWDKVKTETNAREVLDYIESVK